jgi:hypothetical protein
MWVKGGCPFMWPKEFPQPVERDTTPIIPKANNPRPTPSSRFLFYHELLNPGSCGSRSNRKSVGRASGRMDVGVGVGVEGQQSLTFPKETDGESTAS